MKLTVLGCYGPYPPAGGACSGYLVEEGGFHLLLDCGNGVLSRLGHYLDFFRLDAILVSHLHADHISDLLIMRYGLELAGKNGLLGSPLPLYAPPEPAAEYERLPYKGAFTVRPIHEALKLAVGPFAITASAGVHAVPAFSLRLESPSGAIVYSGDTEAHDGLAHFAGGADLFLCEANYLEEDIAAGLPNHLSAAQAARIAAAAGVQKLILTHHHPQRDPSRALSEAQKYFASAVLAEEGGVYPVSAC